MQLSSKWTDKGGNLLQLSWGFCSGIHHAHYTLEKSKNFAAYNRLQCMDEIVIVGRL